MKCVSCGKKIESYICDWCGSDQRAVKKPQEGKVLLISTSAFCILCLIFWYVFIFDHVVQDINMEKLENITLYQHITTVKDFKSDDMKMLEYGSGVGIKEWVRFIINNDVQSLTTMADVHLFFDKNGTQGYYLRMKDYHKDSLRIQYEKEIGPNDAYCVYKMKRLTNYFGFKTFKYSSRLIFIKGNMVVGISTVSGRASQIKSSNQQMLDMLTTYLGELQQISKE